ncbi:hypothetical protein B0T11DRAFT_299757 [Plectosphaerella cucumerina]|uniref:Uncharacterized protein n=1 Tax=Plectosphaerella cucumerina TaxID=40658 RepID=A0A8K0TBV9_9PEZI|nr:hypothetical protein B0T11DRAFT_299757 [Plectosphaerella cucumerina]
MLASWAAGLPCLHLHLTILTELTLNRSPAPSSNNRPDDPLRSSLPAMGARPPAAAHMIFPTSPPYLQSHPSRALVPENMIVSKRDEAGSLQPGAQKPGTSPFV